MEKISFIDQYKNELEQDYRNSQEMFRNRSDNTINIGLFEDSENNNIYKIKIRIE